MVEFTEEERSDGLFAGGQPVHPLVQGMGFQFAADIALSGTRWVFKVRDGYTRPSSRLMLPKSSNVKPSTLHSARNSLALILR